MLYARDLPRSLCLFHRPKYKGLYALIKVVYLQLIAFNLDAVSIVQFNTQFGLPLHVLIALVMKYILSTTVFYLIRKIFFVRNLPAFIN